MSRSGRWPTSAPAGWSGRCAARTVPSSRSSPTPWWRPKRWAGRPWAVLRRAGLLGAVRDGDVLAERLTAAVAAEPDDLVVGPVDERIREQLGTRTATARERLVESLDGVRYRSIRTALDRLAAGDLRADRDGSG